MLPLPQRSLNSRGPKKVAMGIPMTSGDRQRLPRRGSQGKEQEARTAMGLLCDLEQVTDSVSLFSPVYHIEIIEAVLKFE